MTPALAIRPSETLEMNSGDRCYTGIADTRRWGRSVATESSQDIVSTTPYHAHPPGRAIRGRADERMIPGFSELLSPDFVLTLHVFALIYASPATSPSTTQVRGRQAWGGALERRRRLMTLVWSAAEIKYISRNLPVIFNVTTVIYDP